MAVWITHPWPTHAIDSLLCPFPAASDSHQAGGCYRRRLHGRHFTWSSAYSPSVLFRLQWGPIAQDQTPVTWELYLKVLIFFVSGMEPKALCILTLGKSPTIESVPMEFSQVILCTQNLHFENVRTLSTLAFINSSNRLTRICVLHLVVCSAQQGDRDPFAALRL